MYVDVYLCVYVCACVYVCMRLDVCGCICVYLANGHAWTVVPSSCVDVCVCVHGCTSVCGCACGCVWMFVSVWMFSWMHMGLFVRTPVYMYACTLAQP